MSRPKGAFDLAAAKDQRPRRRDITAGPPDTAVGDFAGAFAAAPVKLDATYTTPDQAHAMMEPHASIAAWDGDKLTLWTSNQMIDWSAADLAKTLGIAEGEGPPHLAVHRRRLRRQAVRCAPTRCSPRSARARRGRPVKVALPRPLMFNNTTHRPATIQRIRIGATPDGKITAIGHESWSGNLPGGKPETAVQQTRLLYAGANRMTATRLAVLDLPEGNAMRAPGEAPGMMALEIAMDEMAEKLGIDPVEFRILNDTQVDPEKPERPFSQRQLVECLRIGAERFGWSKRNPQPGQARDGRWLVGMGVAAAFRNNLRHEVGGARAARRPRHRDGRDRHDRHRHRQLHDHRPDRRRDDGRAARQGRRAAGRFDLPGLGRLGRAVGRQQLDRRRLRRLREAARGRGAEARLQRRRRRVRRRRGPLGQPQRAARRGRRRAASSSPRTRSSSATSTRSTSSRPSARTSSRSASMPRPPRSACGACSRSAPRAASSIPRRRAAR